jgi:hypothetical protein
VNNAASHIVAAYAPNGYEMCCDHCGERTVIQCPISVDAFVAFGDAFVNLHRDCKREVKP